MFNKIISIYEDLNIPHNLTCENCDAIYKKPLLPWHIGTKYDSDKGRILFVGKPHRSERPNGSILLESNIVDARNRAKELFFNTSWHYWSYPREIVKKLYGSAEEGWDYISYTNLVKCTSTNGVDKTSKNCTINCVINNKVIIEEIKILKPKKIIFFTWSLHRTLLLDLDFVDQDSLVEHTDINYKKKCGKKNLGWWNRTFMTKWGETIDILVINHPERMKKDEYTDMVYNWLK